MAKRALISVSDKTGVLEFAKDLVGLGYEIISTGGTKKHLEDNGVPVTPVDAITGFPECLDGRVKTLHPMVHGGILGDRTNAAHVAQMAELGIEGIDIVCVNLYPFKSVYQKPGTEHEEMVENIDIGGPTMIRSSAKNYKNVVIITENDDFNWIVESLKNGGLSEEQRMGLALKAFETTAAYDALISRYLIEKLGVDKYRDKMTLSYEKAASLRYGENPHQQASLYREVSKVPQTNAIDALQLHGKELSFNNYLDLNAAVEMVKEFDEPAVVAVKHNTPCGVGVSTDIHSAYMKAYEADPKSIFGGIIAANREVDAEMATQMNSIFLEIVVAPAFSADAFEILTKKKNIRIMTLENLGTVKKNAMHHDYKRVAGGMLVQDSDAADDDYKVVTDRLPTDTEMIELKRAMNIVKHVKSNAIVLFKDGQMIGVGGGQTSRIWAVENAIDRSLVATKGAVLASDAFFPFPDSVERAAKAGITAIIHPGGSNNDQESIDAANKYGIAMVVTGVRHFKH